MDQITAIDLFATPLVELESRKDGSKVLISKHKAEVGPARLDDAMALSVAMASNAPCLASIEQDEFSSHMTYQEVWNISENLAANLITRNAETGAPLLILSGNSMRAALLTIAGYRAGVPVCTVSQAHSLASKNMAVVNGCLQNLKPGFVYVEDGAQFAPALADISHPANRIIAGRNELQDMERFDDFVQPLPGSGEMLAGLSKDPHQVARYLLTSGSTGVPKIVPNTHHMLTSNQYALRTLWPFLKTEPPILVDWLPWSHTFGANHNFHMALMNQGCLVIDQGNPSPEGLNRSIAALKQHPPTIYFNVPRGFATMLPQVEQDADLRHALFSRLRLMFYAGAALPARLAKQWSDMAEAETGRTIPMVSGWGTTETSPSSTAVHQTDISPGNIGTPLPGVAVKLVPQEGLAELRVKGPNVFPGYFDTPEQNTELFDDEGYFCTGDAGALANPDNPAEGIMFRGRLGENFKLSSGTWVRNGVLRSDLLDALKPLAADLVLTGHDRDALGVLIFPNVQACAAELPQLTGDAQLIESPALRAMIASRLTAFNRANPNSSRRIERALLLATPPDLSEGEINDKGYINQRRVLERRATAVNQLYGSNSSPNIVP